jgi:hypothetical protein
MARKSARNRILSGSGKSYGCKPWLEGKQQSYNKESIDPGVFTGVPLSQKKATRMFMRTTVEQTSHVSAKSPLRWLAVLLVCLAGCSVVFAGQIDIQGPPGSEEFGKSLVVLPNGNIVVWNPYQAIATGAVYLLSPNGDVLSELTGTGVTDKVGSGGIVVLANGNFVVVSPNWDGPNGGGKGAVTWVNGATGLSGPVSASNSLVGNVDGDRLGDRLGESGVVALSNGNYVVVSSSWSNGAFAQAGAITLGNGAGGSVGPVSISNSLVGSAASDQIGSGGVVPLGNGNYVVCSPNWSSGAGAATWVDGSAGMSGAITSSNSLIGALSDDYVCSNGAVALANGNYAVISPDWDSDHGAVTWGSGGIGISGVVGAANSLLGAGTSDRVGSGGVIALTNGNYVVLSPQAASSRGAATWANGDTGLIGTVGVSNSLVGGGSASSVGLSNGNYVVASPHWRNQGVTNAGATTWADGAVGLIGEVSASNSLVGSSPGDGISQNIVPLSNGNYVVSTVYWDDGSIADVGAVTWCGQSGCVGTISSANSLVGSTQDDELGAYGIGNAVTALRNGNFVVACSSWDNGALVDAGAVTFGNGETGLTGTVSAANSLVGTHADDQIGASGIIALSNGNYAIGSVAWDSGIIGNPGAVTWSSGTLGIAGTISQSNSLVGTTTGGGVGGPMKAFDGGYYGVANNGAVTMARGDRPLLGPITSQNSIFGGSTFDFDPFREQFVVGRPSENIVSIRQFSLFADGFD